MNDGELYTARIYAWIGKDLDGCEGIIAVPTDSGLMPLLATDEVTVRSFKDLALYAAGARKQTVRLVVFERGMTLDTSG